MDAGNGTGRAVAAINITPMIDILLVLLIIFLMIHPTRPSGLDSQIPQPPKSGESSPPSPVVVEVQPRNAGTPVYMINQKPFAREEVLPELRTIFAGRMDRTMFLKGDAALAYQDIASVVDMGRQAGVERVALLTPEMDLGR